MNGTVAQKTCLFLCVAYFDSAGGALATESVGGAQEQARILLTGQRSDGADRVPPAAPAPMVATARQLDAQELARRVIMGQPTTEDSVARIVTSRSSTIAGSCIRAVDGGAQEMARRAILGDVSQMVTVNLHSLGCLKMSLNGAGQPVTTNFQR